MSTNKQHEKEMSGVRVEMLRPRMAGSRLSIPMV